jgi:hypothetical protein
MIFVENISYANEDITIFPAINEYKESKEKELRADFGKCLGIVDIEGKEYVYYDSRLDKIDEINLNRLRPFELLLYSKTVSKMNTKMEAINQKIKINDKVYKKIKGWIAAANYTKALASFLIAIETKAFAQAVFDFITIVLPGIEKKWNDEWGNEPNFMNQIVYPVFKEQFTLVVNMSLVGFKNLNKDLLIKNFLPTCLKNLGVIFAAIDLVIKTEELTTVTYANWTLRKYLEESSFEIFAFDFINEYVFVHRCNIVKMAKKYNVKNENFWSLWLKVWNKKNSYLNYFFFNENDLAKIARDTLNIIEKYGDGGMYRSFGNSYFYEYFSEKSSKVTKDYKFEKQQNMINYFFPNNYKSVTETKVIEIPVNATHDTIHPTTIIVPVINNKKEPLIEINKKTLSYENQIVHFSDGSTESRDVIKISAKITITFEFNNSKDIQQRTISEMYIPAPTHPFPDVDCNEWYAKYVANLYNKKIIVGDTVGNFNPHNSITAGEFLKIFTKSAYSEESLLNIDIFNKDSVNFSKYPLFIVNDIEEKGLMVFKNTENMNLFKTLFGIESEDSLKNFLLSEILRNQVAQFIYYFYSYYYSPLYEKIEIDCGTINDYGWDNCSSMLKSIKLMEGNSGYFIPDDLITRAEMAKVVYNFGKISNIKPKKIEALEPTTGGGQIIVPDNNYFPNSQLIDDLKIDIDIGN